MRRFLAIVTATFLAFGTMVIVAPSAHAVCDWATYYKTSLRKNQNMTSIKSPSEFNRTRDKVTLAFTSSNTKTRSNTTRWEVGAEVGFPVKIVEAKVSGKYGRDSTRGVSRTTSVTKTITIRPGHSGWSQLNLRRAQYVVQKRRIAPHCGDVLDARAVYYDWFYNSSSHTRQGRVPW